VLVDLGDDERRHQEQLARWATGDLALFAVEGLRRVRGGNQSGLGSALTGTGRDPVRVVMSREVRFLSDDGASIAITSHRKDTNERYEMTRAWALMTPYLATPQGRAAASAWDRSGPAPRPPEGLGWTSTSIIVDGEETPFEVCELGAGVRVAVGQVPDAIISIDSRGVPLSSVRLARLTESGYPSPKPPDLGENTLDVIRALDDRLDRLPLRRVRRRSDYWALRSVETEHAQNLAHRYHLNGPRSKALDQYWLEMIDTRLANKLDSWDRSHMMAMHRSRIAKHLGTGFLFQLWFNTLGPGAKTWFGNRYVSVRHYTFRIRWRP
jgi:hypothetical protein